MSTPGLVTVMSSENKVVMKILAGCNGSKAEKVANQLKKTWPISIDDVYKAAKKAGFGCTNCLVVVTSSEIKHETGAICRKGFQRPKSHPLSPRLDADLIRVIKV